MVRLRWGISLIYWQRALKLMLVGFRLAFNCARTWTMDMVLNLRATRTENGDCRRSLMADFYAGLFISRMPSNVCAPADQRWSNSHRLSASRFGCHRTNSKHDEGNQERAATAEQRRVQEKVSVWASQITECMQESGEFR